MFRRLCDLSANGIEVYIRHVGGVNFFVAQRLAFKLDYPEFASAVVLCVSLSRDRFIDKPHKPGDGTGLPTIPRPPLRR